MTREEALKKFILNQAQKNSEDLGFILLGEIYDDFESNTCEQCEHFIEMSTSCFIMPIDIQILPKGFCCNKFENKDMK